MQCWDDLGQAKAQWKEIEAAEIKKGLPDWVIYESIKPKLEEIGAYGIEGKIYTRDNKKVVFLRDADMKEAQKLESEGNYVIVVSGGMKAPFLTDK
jgi:restriction endonuclease S subunit